MSEIHLHVGLFKMCTAADYRYPSGLEYRDCEKFTSDSDHFGDSRARGTIAMVMMTILGGFVILCLGIADAVNFVVQGGHTDKSFLMMKAVIGVAIVGMCASIVALVLWTEYHKKEIEPDLEAYLAYWIGYDPEPGYSLDLDALGIDVNYGLSWRLALAGGIVFFLALLSAIFRISSAHHDAAQLEDSDSDAYVYTASNDAYETDVDSRAAAGARGGGQPARNGVTMSGLEMRPGDVQIV